MDFNQIISIVQKSLWQGFWKGILIVLPYIAAGVLVVLAYTYLKAKIHKKNSHHK